MKTIAITGGTGFIGQYLIPELLKDDRIQVRCLTRRTTFGDVAQHKNFEYVRCDYTRKELSCALLGCDSVIHMGGYIPNQVTLSASQEEFSDECIGMIHSATTLFDVCAQHKIQNVVFLSSIAVYGKGNGSPFEEAQRCDPASAYGIAKLTIEKIAGYYHDQFGLNVKSLRISQVFGARKDIVRRFLRMLVENGLKKEPLTLFGTGTATQDYVYVRDVCLGIVLALQHPDDFGEFNIGSGRPISSKELAEAHCIGFENPAGVVYVKDGKEIMSHRSLNIEKAKRAWGYEPSYTLVEACKEMYELYQQNTY